MSQKSLKKKPPKHNLVIVAHPDDELIFFGGLILSERKTSWKVICVTDGNADGRGAERRSEFQSALSALNVGASAWLNMPDIYTQRLNLNKLILELKSEPAPLAVYTHGPLGEYGHPHHQDVSLAAHRVFFNQCPVWSPAFNTMPDRLLCLSPAIYKKKSLILTSVYGKETARFLNLLPLSWSEGFLRLPLTEVEAIYKHLTEDAPLSESLAPHFKPIVNHIKQAYAQTKRNF
jgi:LmbE family N-acetylglucosaminyl deacetylase